MILDKQKAEQTAGLLLDIQAIKLRPEEPFTWASGWHSPIYCDNRITLSFPKVRQFLCESIANIVQKQYPKPDVIAGVATGAIAIGVLVAERLGLPFVYVRPEPKKHGRQNQVEGSLAPGARVVVIEDLISTGGSSLQAVEALRGAGAEVLGMVAIFTYGFAVSQERFGQAAVELVTVSDYSHLIEQAQKTGYIKPSEMETLSQWRLSPDTWGR